MVKKSKYLYSKNTILLEMEYNRGLGKSIMQKYLSIDGLQKRLEHTQSVAEFAFKVAEKIKEVNPELVDFDPELVGFLGYTHDIGYSIESQKHEVHTIDLLINNEEIPSYIARMAMHGQLLEQFGEKEGNIVRYLPIGLEGMILTYADMSVRIGGPIPIGERAKEIIERVQGMPSMPDDLKEDIVDNMYKALPRFEKYERIVLAFAGVDSVKDF